MQVGATGQVTAHADGATGATADFDWGDSTAATAGVAVVDGAASAPHTYAANGTFTVTGSSGGQSDTAEAVISDITVEEFDAGAHTVAEVQEYVDAHPEQAQAVRDAEAAGKARSTLLAWLDEVLG